MDPSGLPARRRRLAARALTGRAGHLYGGTLDWLELLARLGLARLRCRRPPG